MVCTEGTTNTLKDHLIDELDYVLMPQEAWKKVVSWYTNVNPDVSIEVVLGQIKL